jgi:hypothetical protein
VVFALLCPAVCAQGASAAHIACLPFDHVSLWQLPSQRLQGVLFFGYAKRGAPPTGWPYTTQLSHPDCRGPEAKPYR